MKNKVLLVDDDDTICELGKEMFEILGMETIVSQTFDEAVKNFQEFHQEIALVLIDYILDNVSGVEVFKALRDISPDFVGVLASGIFIDEDAPKYLNIGFREIIRKPYSLSTLKELVAKYVT